MKYLILIISLVLILIALPQTATSQSVNFDQLFQTLHDLQTKIDTMVGLARLAQEGKITVPFVGDITFTADQRQALVQQYLALKAELAVLYQQLP